MTTRTVTICIPPRDEDLDGEAHWFSATVEEREVVAVEKIEAPKFKNGRLARE